MVKPTNSPGQTKKRHKPRWKFVLFPIVIVVTVLYSGLPPFLELDEKEDYVLSEDRLKDYFLKPQKSENAT